MRRADCTGGQHDSIGGQQCRSGRSRDLHPDRPAAGNSHPPHPGARQDARDCAAPSAAPRNAAPGPARTPSTMLSGTAPIPVGRPDDPPSLRSGSHGNPALWAASAKIAVLPTISRVRRTGIGPLSPWAEPCGKSRSVSIARKCGSTSDQDQPAMPHSSKSAGTPRQKYPPLTAPDPPTVAPRTRFVVAHRALGQHRFEPRHQRAGLRPTAAADHCRSAQPPRVRPGRAPPRRQ